MIPIPHSDTGIKAVACMRDRNSPSVCCVSLPGLEESLWCLESEEAVNMCVECRLGVTANILTVLGLGEANLSLHPCSQAKNGPMGEGVTIDTATHSHTHKKCNIFCSPCDFPQHHSTQHVPQDTVITHTTYLLV